MTSTPSTDLDPALAFPFYRHALRVLQESRVPFLVGGAYALARYTGIVRHTKDLDLFLRRIDVEPAVDALRSAGYRAEIAFAHWLGKAFHGTDFVDLIFNSGNGLCPVDSEWFAHAVDDRVLGVPVQLVPIEEMLWQKMFIMERERFDGADVNHLLRACGRRLDWSRLLQRVGPHGDVLLGHLVLFRYVYPDERDAVPTDVLELLLRRAQEPEPAPGKPGRPRCRGTLLSRMQYVMDVEEWGLVDARTPPDGTLSPGEAHAWTEAGRV